MESRHEAQQSFEPLLVRANVHAVGNDLRQSLRRHEETSLIVVGLGRHPAPIAPG